MYAVKSNNTTELINRMIHAADHITNNQEMVTIAIMSIIDRVQLYVDNQSGNFENAYRAVELDMCK